jgi:hypothetical protein
VVVYHPLVNDDPRSRARRRGSPEAIGELLGRARGQPLLRAAAAVLEIRRAWGEIAGEVLARRSEPAAISGERLIVHVTSNAWLNELQFMREELLERLQQSLPRAGVQALEVRIGPVSFTEEADDDGGTDGDVEPPR